MHSLPTLHDWKVSAISENCISIVIDEDLSIEGLKLKVLGKDRNFLFEVKPSNREIILCTPTGNPMFVELHTPDGISVHYVEGSGSEYYSKN
jgi:hypothetical protein